MATVSATNGGGTVSPIMVTSPYESSSRARTVVHDTIGGGIAVSLIAPNPRDGEISYLFATAAEAAACITLHQQPTSFALSDTGVPEAGMTYVVAGGAMRAVLDDQTLTYWAVLIRYQEIVPE